MASMDRAGMDIISEMMMTNSVKEGDLFSLGVVVAVIGVSSL